ncbi:MAG TPA: 3-dehydroquinate synthase [Moorella mulderi]|nr:3-dehydroquinate synthase [Moorella mulderi]
MVRELRVELGDRSYPIVCGPRLLEGAGGWLKRIGRMVPPALVVSNPTVADLYWPPLEASLKGEGWQPHLILLPDSEEAKTLKEISRVYDLAGEIKMERKSPLIALGGGVVGDAAGFVATTWLRGLPFIQIPTTLLAQVDASVGGKVALNHPQGKNLIGAFYQPRLVLIDVDTLKTLPEREFRSGLAEVIKYGVIMDRDFFEYIEQNLENIMAGQPECLMEVVCRSCSLKARVVAQDEREETGLRRILNFGHTVGHAVEAATGFSLYRHGEAVAIGMALAARMAVEMGIFSLQECRRLLALLKRAGLPTEMPPLNGEAFRQALLRDKKIEGGRILMVLPVNLGRVEVREVSWEEILRFI